MYLKGNLEIKKDIIIKNGGWPHWMATCRKIQIDFYISPRITLNPKYIKKSKPDTLSIIEEKVGIVLISLVQERLLEMDTNSTGTKNNG